MAAWGVETMPKNIVLLSDGTGNSSAKLFTTNVWRLYQALDLGDPALQVAFYDNGVGTSSFKPLAILGGIFGYGLKRNVIALYSFLCRNYHPHEGDRIFGFGFSRGAFTIRIVAGLVAHEWLVPYTGDEAKLARNAKAAYRQYRERFTTTARIEVPFRWIYHSVLKFFNPPVPLKQRHQSRIHFLGLWDTVDAYGGPIEEITRAIDFGLFPLSMPDRYMPDKIDRACHALALDDERRAFWPVLWDEFHVVGSDGNTRRYGEENWSPPAHAAEGVARLLPAIDQERLSQVWFAGMHADVGGGYPQAGLSYVTLDWMMDRAVVYGLLLKPQEEERLRRCADQYDKLNDSRHGLGGYYRYQPRRVVPLLEAEPRKASILRDIGYLGRWLKHPFAQDPRSSFDNGLDAGSRYSPKIHESVFRRIAAGTDGYSPIVIPATYRVTTKDGRILSGHYESDSQAISRACRQERVWNWVWGRRVAYFATLLVSVALAATPLLLLKWPGNGEASLAAFLIPPIDVVGRFLPSFASYWIDAFKQAPTWLFLGGGALAALLIVGGRLQLRIHDRMRPLWRGNVSVPPHPHPVAPSPLPRDPLYLIRSSMTYRGFFYTLTRWVLPGVCFLAIVYGLSVGINRALFSIGDSLGFVCAGSSAPAEAKGQETPIFATKTLCHPTTVTVTKNQTYLITLKIMVPWRDNGIATDPKGFDRTKMTWKMWFGLPMRRLVTENWFQIVVRVGSQGLDEQVLTTEIVPSADAAAPAVFAGTFTAKDSGEVFLFVNDAVIGLPGLMNIFYANNAGEARVTIQPAP
jgi:uncharacterized protein (DUF2235 family)